MNIFTMIVVLAAVFFLTKMIVQIVEIKQSKGSQSASEQVEARITQLEKRLANLETILTSKDFHLKQAFSDLDRDNQV